MKITDVWREAFVRLGAEASDANKIISLMTALASSREAFDAWDSRLPDGAGRALLKGIRGDDGVAISRTVIEQFRKQAMARWNISEEEIARLLSGVGLN